MSRFAKNLGGMVASRAWNALLLLGLVPLYIKFLGVEAYGVVGAFVTLQAFVSLLDLGLGTTLTREFARMSGDSDRAQEMRNLLRTLEVPYFVAAIVIASLVWLVAPLVATHWLRLGALSTSVVKRGLIIAGFALALQWPKNLYGAGLEGLQRQMRLAWLTAITATVRAVVTISALRFLAPTLEVFFFAQAVCNAMQTAALAVGLWVSMPRAPSRASFSLPLLRTVRRFAAGMTGISITSVALTQLDKAVLSKTLPLKMFGYYVIASTLASGLYVIVGPVFAVVFPRLSVLVSQNRVHATAQFYDMSAQLMAVIVFPVTAVIALYSSEVLQLWTGNQSIAANGGILLTLIIVGNSMNGLMNVPYAMQLAHGWTALAFCSNLIAIIICVPLTYVLSLNLGAEGGALVWVLLTFGYIAATMPLMHRRVLPGRLLRWYLVDVGGPALAAFVTVAAGRLMIPRTTTSLETLILLVCLTGVACLSATAVAPDIRQTVMSRLYGLRTAG